MVYKLPESAQRYWKRIKGFNLLALVSAADPLFQEAGDAVHSRKSP
jgi:hypothetical protein